MERNKGRTQSSSRDVNPSRRALALLVTVRLSTLDDTTSLKESLTDLTLSLARLGASSGKLSTDELVHSTTVFVSLPVVASDDVAESIRTIVRNNLASERGVDVDIVRLDASTRPEQVAQLLIHASAASERFDWIALLPEDGRFRSSPTKALQILTDNRKTCVALLDQSFAGFPTFPCFHASVLPGLASVLARLMADGIFAQGCYCKVADDCCEALLFEAFFRFRNALIVRESSAVRQGPRKRTQKESLARSQFLIKHLPRTLSLLSEAVFEYNAPLGSMDVITPSFRATQDVLERILALPAPDDCAIKFIIVCDNPDSKSAVQVFRDLEQACASDYSVKVRFNPVNVGPGGTRNHGLAESCSDYVCFLDDDVFVEKELLREYWKLAKDHPSAAGFIGSTVLPSPQSPRQFAVKYAGIASFWDIASKTTRDLPWGITANLCIKRDAEVFFHGNEVFTRGGGGEDVDLCLRLDRLYRKRELKSARSFVPAPKAVVHHPYWNGGLCFLKQFFGWAKGDSALIELYPDLSFRSALDFTESFLVLATFESVLALLDLVSPTQVVSFLMAFVLAEWLYETLCHVDLVPVWGGVFTAKVGLETCVVRTCSEVGRFRGQLERGTFLQSFGRRFDWFQDNWPEYPKIERIRAVRRGAFRIGCALWASRLITNSSAVS